MEQIKITLMEDGRLRTVDEHDQERIVKAVRCFPWSYKDCYISLRDDKGQEISLIDNLDRLEQNSRQAIEKALGETDFLFHIQRIDAIETEFEIRNWKVLTQQGGYQFQTKLNEWPQKLKETGYLIKDVAGNLFCIENIQSLDKASQKLLWAYLD